MSANTATRSSRLTVRSRRFGSATRQTAKPAVDTVTDADPAPIPGGSHEDVHHRTRADHRRLRARRPGAQGQHIAIAITKRGFDPDSVTVPARTPVTLVFTRKTDQTCTKKVVLSLDDGKKIERDLPLDQPIEIAVTFPKAGKLVYACGMDMTKGTIVVQ